MTAYVIPLIYFLFCSIVQISSIFFIFTTKLDRSVKYLLCFTIWTLLSVVCGPIFVQINNKYEKKNSETEICNSDM